MTRFNSQNFSFQKVQTEHVLRCPSQQNLPRPSAWEQKLLVAVTSSAPHSSVNTGRAWHATSLRSRVLARAAGQSLLADPKTHGGKTKFNRHYSIATFDFQCLVQEVPACLHASTGAAKIASQILAPFSLCGISLLPRSQCIGSMLTFTVCIITHG